MKWPAPLEQAAAMVPEGAVGNGLVLEETAPGVSVTDVIQATDAALTLGAGLK
jgi:hypothetical protein